MKVLRIADTDITIDTRNGPATIPNTYVKPYYSYREESYIYYLEITNDLAKNLANKPINKEISMPFDYPEPQKLCSCEHLWKSHFINDFIDKIADLFISHREHADYIIE